MFISLFRPLSPRWEVNLLATSKRRGIREILFSTSAIPVSDTSLQTFFSIFHEVPEAASVFSPTNRISQGSWYFSDLAEMFFCNLKIQPCRGLYVCQRCFFQMLKTPSMGGGVGVFSSLYCFPEVEWVDALSFKVGAFLKSLSPSSALCSENLIPPHNVPTVICYVISKKKLFLVRSHGKSVRGKKFKFRDEILHDEGSFVVHLTWTSVCFFLVLWTNTRNILMWITALPYLSLSTLGNEK